MSENLIATNDGDDINDYNDMPPLLDVIRRDQNGNIYVLSIQIYENHTIYSYQPYFPVPNLSPTPLKDEFDIINKQLCLKLLNDAKQQIALQMKKKEPMYEGINGEDILIGHECYVINESWSFPLFESSIERMIDNNFFRNPYFDEPIKRIVKIQFI